MKFTIKHAVFLDMLKQVGKKLPHQRRGDNDVRISACASMVFVESNHAALGVETQVAEDGQCLLARKPFIEIVKTFSAKDRLTIKVSDGRLQIDTFSMGVQEYLPHAAVPANYATQKT